jgi:S1-C subfamily serine protease
MIAHGRRVVVTAAHVVRSESVMAIDGRDGETVVGQVVFKDEKNDIAFILVPEIDSRTAVRYRPQHHYDDRLIGTNLTYTGFPSHHDLLTIRGYVASLEHDMVVTNMFGWFGASGSGVFDQQGRYVGCVSGIDVGRFGLGFRIPLDSIVWVAPVSQIDHEMVKVRILSADPPDVIRAFPGARAPRRGGVRD